MSLRFPSGRLVSQCKKDSKRLAKAEGISLHAAQDQVARDNGMDCSWAEAMQNLKGHSKSIADRIVAIMPGCESPNARRPYLYIAKEPLLQKLRERPALFDKLRTAPEDETLNIQNIEKLTESEMDELLGLLRSVGDMNKTIKASYTVAHSDTSDIPIPHTPEKAQRIKEIILSNVSNKVYLKKPDEEVFVGSKFVFSPEESEKNSVITHEEGNHTFYYGTKGKGKPVIIDPMGDRSFLDEMLQKILDGEKVEVLGTRAHYPHMNVDVLVQSNGDGTWQITKYVVEKDHPFYRVKVDTRVTTDALDFGPDAIIEGGKVYTQRQAKSPTLNPFADLDPAKTSERIAKHSKLEVTSAMLKEMEATQDEKTIDAWRVLAMNRILGLLNQTTTKLFRDEKPQQNFRLSVALEERLSATPDLWKAIVVGLPGIHAVDITRVMDLTNSQLLELAQLLEEVAEGMV